MSNLSVEIKSALVAMASTPLKSAATALFGTLGYTSQKTVQLDGKPESFAALLDGGDQLVSKPAAHFDQWKRVDFLFQLTNDEIPMLAAGQRDLLQAPQDFRTSIIESFVFLAIELQPGDWTRGALASMTREINRVFPMPAVILFKHGDFASIAVIDRRPNKKDGTRDVVERRISIIKDINLNDPHRAQVDILRDLALENVKVRGRGTPSHFRDLYDGWLEALSAQALNKRFYQELANWYFWSVKQVTFPTAALESDPAKRDEQNQIAVIRLLTRLIFVWFIKEKGLVPRELFETDALRKFLVEDPGEQADSSTYYKAILQNLFFATLNTEMSDDRKWRSKAPGDGLDGHYLIHSVYRFKDAFRDPDAALDLFKKVPFLNGGLFECLDREVSPREIERNPDLKRYLAPGGKVLRIDGFSERGGNPLNVPNKIFFSREQLITPSDDYDPQNGKSYKAMGLIELFSRYKFTVEENTPVEEEVALDPELLGKVFENLLASYNSDTKTTARKKSGSFYTPREVVDYMVDEALIAYFLGRLTPKPKPVRQGKPIVQGLDFGAMPGELDLSASMPAAELAEKPGPDFEARLRALLSYRENGNPFSPTETDALITAIDSLRALDPACGSGAFPMGLLQKLIHILHRLDPDGKRWYAQNRRPLEEQKAAALRMPDPSRRDAALDEVEASLAKLDHDFSDANKPDYARKLYLIDKCLFGVDLQPIAVQIAKLRFFISLVVSQKIDPSQPNLNITALPNLETKLVAADSLMRVDRQAGDLLRDTRIDQKEAELRAVNERYFSARTVKTKRKRREEIGRLRDELADLLVVGSGVDESNAKLMAAWDPFDQNSHARFFDPEWMFGLASPKVDITLKDIYRVGPFDLVIGNPPYVRHESIKEHKRDFERLYGGKDRNGNAKGAFNGTADLLVYFIQRGIELLKPGGAFAYITSNKWYRLKYGAPLRSWLNRNARLCHIIDFGDAEVFDALAYPTIIVATRRVEPVHVVPDTDTLRVMNWPADRDRAEVEGFSDLVETLGFDLPQKTLANDSWQLEPQAKRRLLEQLRTNGTPLRDFVSARVYRGITTGFNEAFVVDRPTRDRLIADHESAKPLLKPYMRGTDVERWQAEPKDLWLIKIPSSENVSHPWSGAKDAESVFKSTYPSIYHHVMQYRRQLVERYDQGRYFWELRSCKYWDDFTQRKILSTKISFRPSFCVDNSGAIVGNTAYFIRTGTFDNYLVALLNSSISEYYSRNTFASKQGGFYEVQPEGLEVFPVPQIDSLQSKLMNKIDYGLIAVSDNRIEQLLNGFVYELFFKDDLHSRNLKIFDEAEHAGLAVLAGLEGEALIKAADSFAATHLVPGARLRTMLSDLQTLDVVRIIEGRE